jgi:hypothetical protein
MTLPNRDGYFRRLTRVLFRHQREDPNTEIEEELRDEWSRAKRARYDRVHRVLYPEMHQAMRAVQSALRSGELVRPNNCERCGKRCKPIAHHNSYEPEKWLDVEWLCRSCHGKEHADDEGYKITWDDYLHVKTTGG